MSYIQNNSTVTNNNLIESINPWSFLTTPRNLLKKTRTFLFRMYVARGPREPKICSNKMFVVRYSRTFCRGCVSPNTNSFQYPSKMFTYQYLSFVSSYFFGKQTVLLHLYYSTKYSIYVYISTSPSFSSSKLRIVSSP